MAYVNHSTVHYHIGKTIDYNIDKDHDFRKIVDPTDEETLYVYCDHCTIETADIEFMHTLHKSPRGKEDNKDTPGHKNVLGYNIWQSFKPGEVTAEEAHEIGKEYADKLFGGKYQYVVTTHLDKGHYHNHIVFCAVDYVDHKKFRYVPVKTPGGKRLKDNTLSNWREVSDEICRQHGLSIIEKKEKGSRYKNTKERTKPLKHREQLRQDIDKALQNADTYEEFLNEMAKLGYEIKQTSKNTAFRYKDWDRFARLTEKSVGEDYTEDAIRERIITKRPHIPKRMRNGKRRITLIIDIEHNIKIQSSKGYENWARVHNLQEASKTLNFLIENDIGTYEEMDAKAGKLREEKKQSADKIKDMDTQIHDLKERIGLVNSYNDVKRYAVESNESTDKKKYKSEHREELEQFKVLDEQLRRMYPGGKLPNEQKMSRELEELMKQREAEYEKYTSIDNDIDAFTAAKRNVDMYMKRNEYAERDERTEQQAHQQTQSEPTDRKREQSL